MLALMRAVRLEVDMVKLKFRKRGKQSTAFNVLLVGSIYTKPQCLGPNLRPLTCMSGMNGLPFIHLTRVKFLDLTKSTGLVPEVDVCVTLMKRDLLDPFGGEIPVSSR